MHPEVSGRSCRDCRDWIYDEKIGIRELYRNEPVARAGRPTPCQVHEKACKKGHFDNQLDLSPKNEQALQHYYECEAVHIFPEDAIVKYNASLISRILKQIELERSFDISIAGLSRGRYG